MSKGAVIIEGHVQGLANLRSLAKNGINVFVIDTGNCIARYSKYCSSFFKCPNYLSDDFPEFLIRLALKENIIGWTLFPSNDHAVYNISKHREILSKYYKIITPEIDIIVNIYYKKLLVKTAKVCGVSTPATWNILPGKGLNNENISYPVLIKGNTGLSFYKLTGKKAFIAYSENEFVDKLLLISRVDPKVSLLVQELIPSNGRNKTISFSAFCVGGEIKTYWMGVKLREHPHRFGTATFAESVYIEECLKISKVLLKELDYTGVCEVEYLLDPRDNQYKLIEINARTWLWVDLAINTGINFPVYIFNYLNNIEQNYSNGYKTGIKWRNIITDTFFSLKAILSGKLKLSTYKSQNRGIIVDTLLFKGDLKPFFSYLLLLFYFNRRR